MTIFIVEDESHAETFGEYISFSDALSELKKRSIIPWDLEPNRAPCQNWKTCGRTYEIIEYDNSVDPWKELKRVFVLEISANGIEWANGFGT